jgi:hypothetical protein
MHPAVHVDAITVRAINNMSILLREFIFIILKCEEVRRNKPFFSESTKSKQLRTLLVDKK